METLYFSFIVPVYNRPEEVEELLTSMSEMDSKDEVEIVIIEDGSNEDSEAIIQEFSAALNISYYKKENTGPGDSRNFGMRKAKGNYFIVLDSDCIIPSQYLVEVKKELNRSYVDCYGGPDAAHSSFSDTQKAIDFVMTSFLTTGGIRGGKKAVDKFQPRSFNMGISKEAFEVTGGFGNIHPGEDPDLTFRIWEKGYTSRLFPKAYVYHKRRIDWNKFHIQVRKFGMVRPILNTWHSGTAKLTYWFPTLFSIGSIVALVLFIFGIRWPLILLGLYLAITFVVALLSKKSLKVALLALFALFVQFFGYGFGFLKSTILVNFSNKPPEKVFPKLFFQKQ